MPNAFWILSTQRSSSDDNNRGLYQAELAEMRARLLSKLEALSDVLPPNPIDDIIDRLGGPVPTPPYGRHGSMVAW